MVLESTMILLDNSEFMRNGDYIPSRMEAQHDAANLLVGSKTQSNPENTVGVLTTNDAELLVSPTDDMGKILSALHGVPVRSSGASGNDIPAAVQVAHLALKHRRNKNGGQRVIIFIGSPVTCDAKALTKAGRQLKKNNVAIDVILMGENEGNEEKMKELVKAANGTHDNCHLVTIPPGVLPSDVLVSSPIVHGGDGGGGMHMGAGDVGGGANVADVGGFAEFGGVDPNMDPELAMALRVSMEEERARQERAAASAAAASSDADANANLAEEGKSGDAMEVEASAGGAVEEEQSEEDLLLQQALAMSMNENDGGGGVTAVTGGTESVAMEEEEEEDEDAAMQMALQMSMQPDTDDAVNTGRDGDDVKPSAAAEQQQQFQDPQFVNQLLGSLPGVDPNDPAIQNALKNLNQQQQQNKKDGDGDGDDKKDEQK
uniref:VWFA domain-containing protein n=1 Tax=Leptocylindrus danicus TaxID=163516 RepID=A0A7S2LGX4_9STRA|mmetsp:Transcript_4769/g.6938  ORF Transcript_4769/g.6938 Transcript_4769/m.6938 type:complete len:431 (+) Transcript_4769:155-1447(+)